MTTPTRAPAHFCDEACGWATGPATSCTCICAGRGHGAFRVIRPRPAVDPFARLPVPDDEEW